MVHTNIENERKNVFSINLRTGEYAKDLRYLNVKVKTKMSPLCPEVDHFFSFLDLIYPWGLPIEKFDFCVKDGILLIVPDT